ncbi:MAG: response regulator [Candidatus Delongbacteria bacterium]|jgi:CheY-like chemotaxis protein|nr:response regulator [Candidatus Delongbacteria bacterium]
MCIRVLIIDDEIDNYEAIADKINDTYSKDEIIYKSDPEEGIKSIEVNNPDIVITDINFSTGNLPNESDNLSTFGYKIGKYVKSLNRDIKIIAMSQYAKEDVIQDLKDEKDWWDDFFRKDYSENGLNKFLKKYKKLREPIIVYKTGLIPKLCKFFAPTNYDGDAESSIYSMTHGFTYDEIRPNLPKVEKFYRSFKDQLFEDNNRAMLNKMFSIYEKKDFTESERDKIKIPFYFNPRKLKIIKDLAENLNDDGTLKNSGDIYAEVSVIEKVWNHMIQETKKHCKDVLDECQYYGPIINNDSIKYIIKQPKPFNLDKFKTRGKSIHNYKKWLKYYGNIHIYFEDKKFNVMANTVEDSSIIKGTTLELILKYLSNKEEKKISHILATISGKNISFFINENDSRNNEIEKILKSNEIKYITSIFDKANFIESDTIIWHKSDINSDYDYLIKEFKGNVIIFSGGVDGSNITDKKVELNYSSFIENLDSFLKEIKRSGDANLFYILGGKVKFIEQLRNEFLELSSEAYPFESNITIEFEEDYFNSLQSIEEFQLIGDKIKAFCIKPSIDSFNKIQNMFNEFL